MTVEQKRGMKGTLKSFDKDEHDVYDTKAKDAMLKFLNRKLVGYNLETIENPNRYGIDLVTRNKQGKVVHCWELEVRYGNWKGDKEFPFREINCIERKDYQWRKEKSFLDKIPFDVDMEKLQVTYVQLNAECTRAVMIDGDEILKHELKPWANRKCDNEYVRQVPVKNTVQVKL